MCYGVVIRVCLKSVAKNSVIRSVKFIMCHTRSCKYRENASGNSSEACVFVELPSFPGETG